MTKRTTDQWEALLDNPRVTNWPWSPMAGKTPMGRLLTERHEAITELVRLHRAFEGWADGLGPLADEMREKGYIMNAEQISAVVDGIHRILKGANDD